MHVEVTDDADVEEFTFQGATIVAETHGAGARTFVLVHGIGMGRKVFVDLIRLLEREATVIAIDLPGYGDAPEPERTPTIERMADLVAAYLRHRVLTDPVLVGHSMGTQVVAEIAVRHPGLSDHIVLAAPTVDDTARSARRQLIRLGRDLLRESPKVLVLGAREYVRAGPHLRRKIRAMLVHRPEDAYPRIRARTLVLRGEDDVVCPDAWCSRVARAIPDAWLASVPDHGHETMISDAGPAWELIRAWLAET